MTAISERAQRRPNCAAVVAVAALSVCCVHAAAQEDLTRPPRITAEPPAPQAAAAVANDDDSPTSEATPATEIEEIVVISDQNPWRLPDLGSAWRAENAEDQASGRIRAELFPLWNPETEEVSTRNPFAVTDDFSRVGFIELFRVRFGGR